MQKQILANGYAQKNIEQKINKMSFINLPLNGKGPTISKTEFCAKQFDAVSRDAAWKKTFPQYAKFEKYCDLEAPIFTTAVKTSNGFLSTVHEAFANERPLILSPNHIWTAIIQAVSIHVNKHAEQLRNVFVAHQGKKNITVRNDELIMGNAASSPWHKVFPEFDSKLRENVTGNFVNNVVAPFSTSTQTTQIVQTITLMDTLQQYFDYTVLTMCGIPRIELLGTTEDWLEIVRRAEVICEQAQMKWWANELIPVLFHFVILSKSPEVAPVAFWSRIYNRSAANGSGTVPSANGWINVFFPYIAGGSGFTRRKSDPVEDQKLFFNSLANDEWWQQNLKRSQFVSAARTTYLCSSDIGDGIYPSGTSQVPFTWDYYGQNYAMSMCGGFLTCVGAASQIEDSVTPLIGWVVAHGSPPTETKKTGGREMFK